MKNIKLVKMENIEGIIKESDRLNEFVKSKDEMDFSVYKLLKEFEEKNQLKLFAYFENEKPIAFASLFLTKTTLAYAGPLFVKKEYRKNKIAEKLLDFLILYAKNNSITKLKSKTWSTNFASINLHKKCNFNLIKIKEKTRINNDDTLIYEKEL